MASDAYSRRIWVAVAPAMVVPLLGALVYFILWAGHPTARWVYALTKLFTVIWPLVAFVFVLNEPFFRVTRAHIRRREAFWVGVFSGGVIAGAIWLLMETPVGDVVRASGGRIRLKAEQLGILENFWVFAVFISLIHSLIEEYYWRWFVYGRLREVRPGAGAHVLAGLAFAAHHVVITTQFFPLGWGIGFGVAVAVGGILWSVMFEHQKTFLGCWVSHLCVDLALMAVGGAVMFG